MIKVLGMISMLDLVRVVIWTIVFSMPLFATYWAGEQNVEYKDAPIAQDEWLVPFAVISQGLIVTLLYSGVIK